MPRQAPHLTAQEVRAISKAGYHAVGVVSGLNLQVSKHGAKSWILRTTIGDKRREVGLGSFPEVSLANARIIAAELKQRIREGFDPVVERERKKLEIKAAQFKNITFQKVAEQFVDKKTKEFKETSRAKQRQRLENTLNNYAYPVIGELPVSEVERDSVLRVIEPIWETKTATAERLRNNIERILDLAEVMGLRTGSNPARWTGNLSHILPSPKKIQKVDHLKALPVETLPEFMKELRQLETAAAKALRFAILTCARSSETRFAEWSEIDLDKKLWVIPETRMKAGKKHTVPLCQEAVNLLKSIKPEKAKGLVFLNINKRLSENAMTTVLKKTMKCDATQHGFRSTFKDWARTHTKYADEVSELALAHVNNDKTRAAYARDELIESRVRLMSEWGEYCLNGDQKEAKVININAGSK